MFLEIRSGGNKSKSYRYDGTPVILTLGGWSRRILGLSLGYIVHSKNMTYISKPFLKHNFHLLLGFTGPFNRLWRLFLNYCLNTLLCKRIMFNFWVIMKNNVISFTKLFLGRQAWWLTTINLHVGPYERRSWVRSQARLYTELQASLDNVVRLCFTKKVLLRWLW